MVETSLIGNLPIESLTIDSRLTFTVFSQMSNPSTTSTLCRLFLIESLTVDSRLTFTVLGQVSVATASTAVGCRWLRRLSHEIDDLLSVDCRLVGTIVDQVSISATSSTVEFLRRSLQWLPVSIRRGIAGRNKVTNPPTPKTEIVSPADLLREHLDVVIVEFH